MKNKTDGKARLVIALAGNPNVGKSTVFNRLTHMRQHTGNWPGKTVGSAWGECRGSEIAYRLVDLPGTYSLRAKSREEELARDFLCFGSADGVVLICDAGALERNMNLVLQVMELSNRVLVCVNLLDEAERRKISIDMPELSRRLGVPVIGISARKRGSREKLIKALDELAESGAQSAYVPKYPEEVERGVEQLLPLAERSCKGRLNARWLSLRLLEGERELILKADDFLSGEVSKNWELLTAAEEQREKLREQGIDRDTLEEMEVTGFVRQAEELCSGVLSYDVHRSCLRDRRIDRVLLSPVFGYPVMLLLLALTLYITLIGANYPSAWLSNVLFGFEGKLAEFLAYLHTPVWLLRLLTEGAYRVLAWVVSVMLPPMAIFFPLFTALEDIGYLPRAALNLDTPFRKCRACGKQALTMCMGFGCNAAGVVGCRIIDSERERLLAIITNSFVPCNGRFPTYIALLTMFFVTTGQPLMSALLLTSIIMLGVAMTFAVTALLSNTLLKGTASSYTLELPPYRPVQLGRVIVSSIFDRTLFVLGRAATVAAPAGVVIWLAANLSIGGESLINICADFLNPIGKFMGLDGVILLAFILGFPANEIVLPIIIMIYSAQGCLTEPGELLAVRELLIQNGWSWVTAVCVILFSLMHWPCSTTLLSIKKETGSWKWTVLSALIPTAAGFLICVIFSNLVKLF